MERIFPQPNLSNTEARRMSMRTLACAATRMDSQETMYRKACEELCRLLLQMHEYSPQYCPPTFDVEFNSPSVDTLAIPSMQTPSKGSTQREHATPTWAKKRQVLPCFELGIVVSHRGTTYLPSCLPCRCLPRSSFPPTQLPPSHWAIVLMAMLRSYLCFQTRLVLGSKRV